MEQPLTVTQFFAVIVPLFAGILVTAYVIFDKINAIRSNNKSSEEQLINVSDSLHDAKTDIGVLQKHERELIQKNNDDLLKFTEILSKINVSLGRFDVTLKHLEEAVTEIKNVIRDKK